MVNKLFREDFPNFLQDCAFNHFLLIYEPFWTAFLLRFIVIITTAQFHLTKLELRSFTGWNPACGVSKICDGEDLWRWSRLEIRLNAFPRSTISQKQFIIIIIIITFIIIIIIIKFSGLTFFLSGFIYLDLVDFVSL